MIRFRNPRLCRWADERFAILLTESPPDWHEFPAFAEVFAAQLGARIVERLDTPMERLWTLDFEGESLRLAYEDYPAGACLETFSKTPRQETLLEALFEKLTEESAPDGL